MGTRRSCKELLLSQGHQKIMWGHILKQTFTALPG